jgi:cytidine deaminase
VSVDPLQFKYPYYTPFQYTGNKPVTFTDLDGRETKKNEKTNIKPNGQQKRGVSRAIEPPKVGGTRYYANNFFYVDFKEKAKVESYYPPGRKLGVRLYNIKVALDNAAASFSVAVFEGKFFDPEFVLGGIENSCKYYTEEADYNSWDFIENTIGEGMFGVAIGVAFKGGQTKPIMPKNKRFSYSSISMKYGQASVKSNKVLDITGTIDLNSAIKEWAAFQRSLASETRISKFNTATVVIDKSTGKLYYGMNRGINISREKIHPFLKANLPEKTLSFKLRNCAECDVVNNALNSGAKWHNLEMHTIGIKPDGSTFVKPQCANCEYTFEGIPIH